MKSGRDEAARGSIPGSLPRPDREHRKPQPTTCYTVVCVKTAVEISEESQSKPDSKVASVIEAGGQTHAIPQWSSSHRRPATRHSYFCSVRDLDARSQPGRSHGTDLEPTDQHVDHGSGREDFRGRF